MTANEELQQLQASYERTRGGVNPKPMLDRMAKLQAMIDRGQGDSEAPDDGISAIPTGEQSSTQPVGDKATVPTGPGAGANTNPGALDLTTVPQDNGYANNEIQTLNNFLRTSGSSVTPAYKAQVQKRLDNLTNYVSTGKWAGATTATSPTTDSSSVGSFEDKLRASLKSGYPSKSQDPAWVNHMVDYYKGKLGAANGDENYLIQRAAGMGNGGSDAAEAGQYAGQNYSSNLSQMGNVTAPPAFNYKPFEAPAPYHAPAAFNHDTTLPTFVAPTPEEALNDPGYKFRLQQGQQALEQSKAAQSTLRGGATLKALSDYGQNSASQEYQNVYSRALSDYQNRVAAQQTGYGQAANTYGINTSTGFNANQLNYNQALGTYGVNQGNALAASTSAQNLYGMNIGQNQFNQSLANNQYQFGANYGLQSNQQGFNQNLATANFAAGNTGAANNAGNYYYDQNGNLVLGAANSQAGATVSGANAWQNALGNVSQSAIDAWYAQKYGTAPKKGNN